MSTQIPYAGATEFLAFANAIALAGKAGDAESIIERMGIDRLKRIVRAIVSSGSTVPDATWGSALADYRAIAADFAETLAPYCAHQALMQAAAHTGELHSRYGVMTSAASASTVNESAAKPVTLMQFATLEIPAYKAVAIVVLSRELLRFGNTRPIATGLRTSLGTAIDSAFLPSLIDSNTPSNASAGSSAANVGTDIAEALVEMTLRPGSRLLLIVEPDKAANLALKMSNGLFAFPDMTPQGGTVAGITVLVSAGLPAETALLVDASQMILASDVVTLSASTAAALQMDSAPTSSAANLVSLFATNSAALNAVQYFGGQKMSDTAVVAITSVAW